MKINQWLLLILFINIVLRIPSLFDPVSYGDECIYLTLGQAFRRGLVFYRDIHDNKPPFLYLVAALAGGKQIWFRVVTIFWTTANAYLIYLVAQKLFQKKWLWLLATLVFVILSYLPEGRIPNGENYMIMPFALGVFLILKSRRWFWAGIAMSIGFLFKVPIGFDFTAIWLAFFIFKPKNIKSIFRQLKKPGIYLLTAGFILPIAVSIIYYWSKGALEPYLRSALMQNMGYLSSWSGQTQETSFLVQNRGLVIRGIMLMAAAGYLFWRRKKLGFIFSFLCLWFVFALFGALLSERPYPHYLIQLVPPASLLIVSLLEKFKPERGIVLATGICLVAFAFCYYHFWWYPIFPYWRNFSQFVTGKIDKTQYFNFFGGKTINDYRVSAYLKTHTSPDEKIFIWGDGACIYALSQRLPTSRYVVNYHIYDFNGFTETLKKITDYRPSFVIKLDSETRQFSELNALLRKNYLPISAIGEARIYYRLK